MKTNVLLLFLALVTTCARGKTITVNSTNNVSPGANETNLVQAIRLLDNGDSIHFNIPGSGPFYLITPPITPENGYPPITNHNVTIDGCTQPGAMPNTNPILSSNNAIIQIVLDSRDGGGHVEDIRGYSTGESAALLIKGATNVTIRGLGFLGPGVGSGTESDPATYAISFALHAIGGHINGCWLGVAPDRTNIFRFGAGVTAFQAEDGVFPDATIIGVRNNAASAAIARGQFNVIVGEYIPIILEGRNQRIAGNFINVFPDGVMDYNANGIPPNDVQALIEIGRSGDNLVIGTDGDGLNDAEERNIFGGVTWADDSTLLEWYGASSSNVVIAGNYFGMAVDGVTRFTNSMKLFDKFNSSATVRIGSDFDSVSDDLEGNVIAMNYPFDALFPAPNATAPPIFGRVDAGARISLRGNRLIGNNLAPFSFADGFGGRLNAFTNYCAPFMETNVIIPALSTNSTQARLRGSCAPGVAPYTNILIDVYLADEEGWTNGQQFQFAELSYTDPNTLETKHHGFPQGRDFLGSFADNGPQDLNPATGQFEFDISALNVSPDQLVTLAANYSADPPGTHNGRTHTSNFAFPIVLQAAPHISVRQTGANLILSWPTNAGIFSIQSTATLSPTAWASLTPPPPILQSGTNYEATLALTNTRAFFRLAR